MLCTRIYSRKQTSRCSRCRRDDPNWEFYQNIVRWQGFSGSVSCIISYEDGVLQSCRLREWPIMADNGVDTVRDIRCIHAITPGVICRIIGTRHAPVNNADRNNCLHYMVVVIS
jgi:hypothetical protein